MLTRMTSPAAPAPHRRSGWWPAFRAASAALILAAIGAQLQRTVEIALAATTPRGSHLPTVIGNFFSFFTIQSNVLALVALASAAAWAWTRGRAPGREPLWLAVLLAAATTYMLVTGVVYNTLLPCGIELPQGSTVPWSNEVLHVVGPMLLLIDLLFAPRRALSWSALSFVIGYPVVWAVYTLGRADLVIAPATGDAWWYPYPFLDPHRVPGGYVGVAGYIAAVIALFALFTVWFGRRGGRAQIAPAATLRPTGGAGGTP